MAVMGVGRRPIPVPNKGAIAWFSVPGRTRVPPRSSGLSQKRPFLRRGEETSRRVGHKRVAVSHKATQNQRRDTYRAVEVERHGVCEAGYAG